MVCLPMCFASLARFLGVHIKASLQPGRPKPGQLSPQTSYDFDMKRERLQSVK